jgi:hypothetical protein
MRRRWGDLRFLMGGEAISIFLFLDAKRLVQVENSREEGCFKKG